MVYFKHSQYLSILALDSSLLFFYHGISVKVVMKKCNYPLEMLIIDPKAIC